MFAPPFWSGPPLSAGMALGAAPADFSVARPASGQALNVSVQRRRRDWADAMLYDLARVGSRASEALEACEQDAGAVMVAYPRDERPLAVYADAERWALSLHRDASVLALVSPGSSPVAVAAFAMQVAEALGEPVAALAPPRGLSDLTCDLTSPLGANGPRFGLAECSTEGIRNLERVLQLSRRGFDLVVTHRLGGRWLSEVCCSPQTSIITIAGPAAPEGREDALHLIGAQDWYGWSICSANDVALRIAPIAGGHLNPSLPCAFPLAEALPEAAADLGVFDAIAASREKRPSQER